MESQLTDSQDPDSLQPSEDFALMHGDGDDLDGYLEDDHDLLAQSEVNPPRKLLRLRTSGDILLSLFLLSITVLLLFPNSYIR